MRIFPFFFQPDGCDYFFWKLAIKNQKLKPLPAFRIGSSSMFPRIRGKEPSSHAATRI